MTIDSLPGFRRHPVHRFGLIIAFVLASLTVAPPAHACLHVPANYQEKVSERTREALLWHDGHFAHLVIGTHVQSTGTLPSELAWVIPLPSVPTHYEETDPELFPELFNQIEQDKRANRPRFPGSGRPTSGPPGIRVYDPETVGNYQVQPIEILDEHSSGAELNHWLEQAGFSAIPLETERYYLHRGAVFLTIKLHNLTGSAAGIRPLHITYRAKVLSLPMKLYTSSDPFDVVLYTLTAQPPDPVSIYSCGFDLTGSMKIHGQVPLLAKLTGGKEGYLTRFEGFNFNVPHRWVRDFPADPSFTPSEADAGIHPSSISPGASKNHIRQDFPAAAILALGILVLLPFRERRLR